MTRYVTRYETHTLPCKECDGEGKVEAKHPSWGTPWCPEAYINVPCECCDGTGKVEIDSECEYWVEVQ